MGRARSEEAMLMVITTEGIDDLQAEIDAKKEEEQENNIMVIAAE